MGKKKDGGSRLGDLSLMKLLGVLAGQGPMTIEARVGLNRKRKEISDELLIGWATATDDDLRERQKEFGTGYSLTVLRKIRRYHRITLARRWGLRVLESKPAIRLKQK